MRRRQVHDSFAPQSSPERRLGPCHHDCRLQPPHSTAVPATAFTRPLTVWVWARGIRQGCAACFHLSQYFESQRRPLSGRRRRWAWSLGQLDPITHAWKLTLLGQPLGRWHPQRKSPLSARRGGSPFRPAAAMPHQRPVSLACPSGARRARYVFPVAQPQPVALPLPEPCEPAGVRTPSPASPPLVPRESLFP